MLNLFNDLIDDLTHRQVTCISHTDNLIVLITYGNKPPIKWWTLEMIEWSTADLTLRMVRNTYENVIVHDRFVSGFFDSGTRGNREPDNYLMVNLLEDILKDPLHDKWHDWSKEPLAGIIYD